MILMSLKNIIVEEFWEAWRFWRPVYILNGIAIAFAFVLVLAALIYRSLP